MKKSREKIDNSILTLLIMLAGVCVVMAILKPASFFSWANLRSMIYQFPEFGIIALGVMICMISGGIDLSLVGIANLAGIIAAKIMLGMGGATSSIPIAIIAALLVGAVCGLFNGFLIGYFELPPMLVTLCGLKLFSGLGLGITGGPALNKLPNAYKFIANGTVLGGIPLILFIFIAVALLVTFVMRRTVFGNQIYFMGSNKTAAKFSGINCLHTTLKTYSFSGMLGGIVGVIISSHFNSAKSDYGSTYTLMSILIVVLGGVHPDGGRGKVLGVLLSIMLVQCITQVFTLLKLDTNWKTFAYGLLLILALVFTIVQDKLAEKQKS